MLKGVLCAGYRLGIEDRRRFDELFDTMLIAKRMDEMNQEGAGE